jgi:KTSC domain
MPARAAAAPAEQPKERNVIIVYTPASRATKKISFDSATSVVWVTYRTGRTYAYHDVPAGVMVGLVAVAAAGGSVGSYVDTAIKKGGFRWEPIIDEQEE